MTSTPFTKKAFELELSFLKLIGRNGTASHYRWLWFDTFDDIHWTFMYKNWKIHLRSSNFYISIPTIPNECIQGVGF